MHRLSEVKITFTIKSCFLKHKTEAQLKPLMDIQWRSAHLLIRRYSPRSSRLKKKKAFRKRFTELLDYIYRSSARLSRWDGALTVSLGADLHRRLEVSVIAENIIHLPPNSSASVVCLSICEERCRLCWEGKMLFYLQKYFLPATPGSQLLPVGKLNLYYLV